MGIAVFYPEPKAPETPAFYGINIGKELTPQERQEEMAFNAKRKAYDAQMYRYNRYASLIALGCAVAILVIALTLAEKLGAVADGMLLGGVFTLLYGIGRGMDTDSNKYRFLVASVGLATTIVLGYLKFAAHKTPRKEDSS